MAFLCTSVECGFYEFPQNISGKSVSVEVTPLKHINTSLEKSPLLAKIGASWVRSLPGNLKDNNGKNSRYYQDWSLMVNV
jgi:hypothetical protein